MTHAALPLEKVDDQREEKGKTAKTIEKIKIIKEKPNMMLGIICDKDPIFREAKSLKVY